MQCFKGEGVNDTSARGPVCFKTVKRDHRRETNDIMGLRFTFSPCWECAFAVIFSSRHRFVLAAALHGERGSLLRQDMMSLARPESCLRRQGQRSLCKHARLPQLKNVASSGQQHFSAHFPTYHFCRAMLDPNKGRCYSH